MEIYIKITFCFLFCLSLNLCVSEKIAIIHWNDVSGQLEKYHPGTHEGTHNGSTLPVPCTGDKCVGGMGNLQKYINELYNNASADVNKKFKITSGNLIGGENGWLAFSSWTEYATFVHKYTKPDFMSIGMKEFGSGLKRTNEFLKVLNETSIVLSNSNCPVAAAEETIFCAKIATFKELTPTIALLGFINPDSKKLSSPGTLDFKNIVTSLKEVVNKNAKYKTFIAVGDGSLNIAKSILESIPKIKLVIYGRGFGSSKNMAGDYPLRHANGYIATAGKYGSTVGKLILDIDSNGNIINTVGSQLVIPQGDGGAGSSDLQLIENLRNKVELEGGKVVGQSIFKLEGGEQCWRQECNLGNLIADAMVNCALRSNITVSQVNQPLVSLWHGGALFDDEVKPLTYVTALDVHKWLPYHNRAHYVKIRGSNLWKVFDASSSGITANKNADVSDWGQFLQVSNGLEIYYSTKGKKKPELQKIRILHEDDRTPIMKDLDMNSYYYVVIPSFILEGRNIYAFAKDFWEPATTSGKTDIGFDDTCVETYLKALEKISIGFEERIWIDSDIPCSSKGSKGTSTTVTVILTIVFMIVILGIAFVGYFYVFPKLTGRQTGFRTFTNSA